jgi:hypothetical protein
MTQEQYKEQNRIFDLEIQSLRKRQSDLLTILI